MPLAGSRGGASGGVWGNAPTVPRATNSKDEVNKGAGSEASLPVTLRFLRSAPKLLYLPLAYCRADGRDRPVSREVFSCCWSFLLQGDAPAGATRGQWKQTKSAVAPLTPSQCAPMFIDFFSLQGGTKGTLNYSNDKSQLWGRAAEGVQRAIGKPSGTMPMTRLEKKSTLLT